MDWQHRSSDSSKYLTWNSLFIFTFAVVLIMQMTGCQPAPTPTPTPVASPTPIPPTRTPEPTATVDPASLIQGTVRIWLSWGPQELNSLHKVIADFKERFPEVSFSIAYFPNDELRSAFEQAVLDGTGPTLLFGPSEWGPELWLGGFVQDLTILADAELQARVDPIAWLQVNYSRALIGLPLERQGIVLFRNRSLVAESAANVEEFVALAQQLDAGEIVGADLDFGFLYSASHLAACSGEFFNQDGDFDLDSPAGLCWLDLLQVLKSAGRVRFNAVEDLEMFKAGNSAWMVESSLNAPSLAQAIGPDNLAIDPWPVYGKTAQRLAGYVWTENAYLVRGSSPMDREVSWAFIRFMLTPEAQLLLSDPREANHIPALAALEMPSAMQAQIESSLSSGVTVPLRLDWDLYLEPLQGAIRSVTTQGATPELALDVARKKIQQALATPGDEE